MGTQGQSQIYTQQGQKIKVKENVAYENSQGQQTKLNENMAYK